MKKINLKKNTAKLLLPGRVKKGFGIVQVGLSLKSHDPSQRANGFLTVAGGIVIDRKSVV